MSELVHKDRGQKCNHTECGGQPSDFAAEAGADQHGDQADTPMDTRCNAEDSAKLEGTGAHGLASSPFAQGGRYHQQTTRQRFTFRGRAATSPDTESVQHDGGTVSPAGTPDAGTGECGGTGDE